ncbi:uncharacterized protein LOC130671441 [Microplitis mediator]|uniref:uncharacterized protein LOC130671441 n=1 Tax=Microplitis mediator TaxID=375433 RepID=UPI00255276A8|nr:uncharacterized protein LOC130671441 [Microplitis mediator]
MFVDLQFGEHKVSRNIKITIVSIAGKVLETLDLYETNGLLADFSTPVYLSQVDSLKSVRRLVKVDNYTFNKTTIDEYARDLGYFTFYQDRSKLASMIHFFKDSLDISVEGNVGNYVLRRLPSNFHNGYYQYIYVQVLENNQATEVWNDFDVSPQPSFNLGASGVKAIKARLFVALDLEHTFDKTPSELMKILLMYFNFIGMMNGNFTSPTVDLEIGAIIIPQNTKPNPYLGSTSPFSSKLHFQQTSELIGFMYTHKYYFGVDNHDIVILMTERLMYGSSEVPPKLVKMDSLNKHKICDVNEDPSIFLSYHVDFQAAHNILLFQLFDLFSSNNAELNKRNGCSKYWNNIQGKRSKQYRTLPTCIIDSYSDYFRNSNCSYFSEHKK